MTLKDRWKRIQAAVGATPDGVPGPQTVGRIEAALKIGALASNGGGAVPDGVLDERTLRNIATLHEKVQPLFREIAIAGKRIALELGAGDYRMISGTRTYAEQDALYAKGRTTAGPRVTNARGGYSNHNFGIAGDFGVFGKDGSYLDSADPRLAARVHQGVADWAKSKFPGDIEWGGDWTSFKDTPHFQFDTGLTLAQMRARVAAGKSVV